MRIKLILLKITVLLFFTGHSAMAQETKAADFSLQAAVDYAIKHNATYLNAELDVKIAKYNNKEILSIGLPQIAAGGDFKDFFEIPTSLLPGEFFGAPPGTFIPVKFGTQYQAMLGFSAQQLIFNSDYIVGVKAAKELRVLSEKTLARTKTETIVTITKAYYTALINKERLKTLDANIVRTKKLFDDTKAMNQNGIVEKIDVDRLELALNNLVTEREKVARLVGVAETLLKFQMGYDLKQPVNLTDEIKADQLPDIDLLSDSKTNYEVRHEYQLLQSQLKLNTIEMKRYKYQYLPSLVAYGSYNQQAQRTEFDFFDFSKKWYPIGIFGATLNIPIFNGGQKYYRLKRAKVAILKTENSINQIKSLIEFEIISASIAYKNAYSSMLMQKKNRELAQSIYDTSKKKYEAGVGSNLELITAESALKESETNYLDAVYNLIIAKTDLEKATGTIK